MPSRLVLFVALLGLAAGLLPLRPHARGTAPGDHRPVQLTAVPAFLLPPARLAGAAYLAARTPSPPPTGTGDTRPSPRIALLLDDFGHDPALVRRTLALGVPVALAFLPYPPRTARGLALAREAGAEILLHLPMEPEDPSADPGPLVLRVDMDATSLRRTVATALAAVPDAVGVNNHMGSRFTAHRPGMTVLMEELAARGLFFVDSRTTPRSVAAPLARAFAVPFAVRDVFVDNEATVAAVRARLAEAEATARRLGAALAIGHPRPATLAALEGWVPEARRRGVRFVRVADYLRWRCRVLLSRPPAACARRISAPPPPRG